MTFPFLAYINFVTARLLSLAFCLIVSSLSAAPLPTAPPAKPEPALPASQSFKEVAPGVLQLGLVTLEPAKRLIRIPAVVSVKDGVVGYLLVGKNGKTRESILTTHAQPDHLQQAMLSLGFKEQAEPVPASPNPEAVVQGVPVRITLRWQADGKQQEMPAENWIWNNKTQEPMSAGDWLYSGFKAASTVFVAIAADPTALLNNPHPNPENPAIWKLKPESVPPIGTPVEVCIQWAAAQQLEAPPSPNQPLTPLPPTPVPDPTSTPPGTKKPGQQ